MSEAVVVALIAGVCAIIGQLIVSRRSSRELMDKIDHQSQMSDQRLDAKIGIINTQMEELTREVRIHNGFAQRMPVLEEKVKQLEARV